MQQRRLRLGDILDDYCPRERRITNHAVVAMIEDEVKQTRCTTCDADHEYKQARMPARRKKDGSVLVMDPARPRAAAAAVADLDADGGVDDDLLPSDDFADSDSDVDADVDTQIVAPSMHAASASHGDAAVDEELEEAPRHGDDEGPVHRRLIRATLPRPDGPSQEWKEPEFTVRQPGGGSRGGGSFDGNRQGQRPGAPGGRGPRRGARPNGPNGGNGQAPQTRFGAPRHDRNPRNGSGPHGQPGNRGGRPNPGQGQGQGPGANRSGQRPPGSGRKRGR